MKLADLCKGPLTDEERRMREGMAELEKIIDGRTDLDMPAKMTVALNFAIGFMAINGLEDWQINKAFAGCMELNPAISMRSMIPAGRA